MIENIQNQRYKGFDGLRAISILLVINSHLGFWGNFPPAIANRAIPVFAGNAGVNLFFVISGFLITSILLKEKSNFGFISIKKFMIRRALRLIPSFMLFIMVIGVLMSLGLIQSSIIAWLLSAAYLYNFVPFGPLYSSELVHTWSLAIEEQYYLIWPWVIAKINIKTLIRFTIGILTICFVF